MKIRQGFVSNSSSSSFIILGIRNTTEFCKEIKSVVDNEPEANCDYGEEYDKGLIFVHPEYEEYKNIDNDESQYKLQGAMYIGLELTEKELDNKTLTQLKEEMVQSVKKNYNVDIDTKELTLEYGEYDR